MTTMLDTSFGWQVPVRQVGAAVPLTTEQPAPADPEPDPAPEPSRSPAASPAAGPDQHDQEPDPAGTDTDNVIPMRPEPEPAPEPQTDDVEQEPDNVGTQAAPPQHDPVDLDPPPEKPDDPFAGGFKLRHASFVGYCMSVFIGAVGQILALSSIFGGTLVAWGAAVIAAAFAEVTMIGAGSWSLELRRRGHPWKLLLVGAGAVCAYAVGLQILHYLPQGVGTAAVFAGASAFGWLLHTTVEHVRVAAYLKDRARYEQDLAEWRKRQQQQQSQRSAASPRSSKPRSARTSARSGRSAGSSRTKSSGSKGKPLLSQDDVTQLVQSQQLGPKDGPAALRKLTKDRYTLPAESTLKRWISAARENAASA